MAYRFTDTGKWRDKWFRRLSPSEKVLWMYLCDVCDIAGFVEVDTELFAFDTGMDESTIEGALKGLERGLVVHNGVLWIRNFLRHQKNLPLNESNRCHKGILSVISEHPDFVSDIEQHIGASKGLTSPTGIGIGIGLVLEGGSGGKPTPQQTDGTDAVVEPTTIDGEWCDFVNPERVNRYYREVRKVNATPADLQAWNAAVREFKAWGGDPEVLKYALRTGLNSPYKRDLPDARHLKAEYFIRLAQQWDRDKRKQEGGR